MVNVPRIHCHSAFKHYEMFHCNQSSGYGNSIFNTTYNFNGGSICGGGFWGGLFGGLGMGLGAGIMNFLGGGMNMFGGMMGGFPMMNMWGGGFPMMNMWGMGGGQRADGAGGKEKTKEKDKTTTNTETKCEGKDAEYLHTLRERLNKIKTSSDPAKAALELYNDINAVIQKQKDDEHNIADEANYKDLKADLEKEWKFELDKDGKATKAEQKPTNPTDPTNPTNPTEPTEPTNPTDSNVSSAQDAVNITLHFARHNSKLVKDQQITGSIIGVKMGADGKPSGYIIDCKGNSGSTFKLKYEVTIDGDIYTIRCISRTHNSSDCKKTLYTPAEGLKYKKEGNELVRLTESDEPLVSEHPRKKDIIKSITYSEDEDDTALLNGYTAVDKNGEATIDGKKVKINKP